MTEIQGVKERLIDYLKKEGIKKSHFEKECGFCNGFVNGIVNTISPQKIRVISEKYTNLNVEWLMTGKGEMERVVMQEGKTGVEAKASDTVLMKALDEIAEQRKLVSRAQDQIDQLIQITKTMAEAMQKNR